MSRTLPPGPKGGYKKGGRPVKPRLREEGPRERTKIDRPWLKLFKPMIVLDMKKLDLKKTNVICAGRAKRLRNRLRNHPLLHYTQQVPEHIYEIWIWTNPLRSSEATLKSGPPHIKLPVSEWKKAPDEPCVYVWVVKPRKK